jgi:hypothetical protein
MVLLFWSVVVIGFFVILAVLWYGRLPLAQSLTHDTINEALVGAERAVIELDVGAGRLQLGAGSVEQMMSGQVQTLTGIETLERTANQQGGAMVYRLISHAPKAIREPARWPQWTLNVNPEIPLELTIRGGMGESKLDLSSLTIDTFNLTTDAGKYTVTFPRTGNVRAEVTGGLSHTQLLIPEDVPVRLAIIKDGQG